MYHLANTWASSDFLPVPSTRFGREGVGYVAIWPTCRALLIFSLCLAPDIPEKSRVM